MLDFSDSAYQFFPADPSRLVMWGTRQANRCYILKGPNHRVNKIEIGGDLERIKILRESGARILFVANHPSHSDPQLMVEIQRRLGIKSFFMAAYDVFLRSDFQAWFMKKLGSFSIDREGSDRKAMSAAIDTLKKGEYALTIFPEGNVYLMNDRLTPFLDGTSFIAIKAQQALKEGEQVWVVPIGFKFTQSTNSREAIWQRLKKLASDSGYRGLLDPSNPEEAVVNVGTHLLAHFLEEHTELDSDFDYSNIKPDELQDHLYPLTKKLVGDLEAELDLPSDPDVFIVDRVRKVRSKIHQIKIDENVVEAFGREKANRLADRAILTFRILAYVLPYLKETNSLDRYAETVERLCEDYYQTSLPPVAPRKAMAKIGRPISVAKLLSESGKPRTAIPELTEMMEKRITSALYDLNLGNRAPGTGKITLED